MILVLIICGLAVLILGAIIGYRIGINHLEEDISRLEDKAVNRGFRLGQQLERTEWTNRGFIISGNEPISRVTRRNLN